MILTKHQKGAMPWEAFVTTYSSDYKHPSERLPQVTQLKTRSEATAAPALIFQPQTNRETWPVFHQYFYKTTNSIYGSGCHSQPPSCSYPLASSPPVSTHAPSVSEARTQEDEVAGETRSFLCMDDNGQLCYVFGGKADVLKLQEAKDQQKTDVLYEEGVIMLSSHFGPACCEDFLRTVCREAGLQHLLHLPVASSPIITIKDAENWHRSLRGLGSTIGLMGCTFLKPAPRRCSCLTYPWETEGPNSCCFKMQTLLPPGLPPGSTLPPGRLQQAVHSTEPSRSPWLTEYRARYTAAPEIQQ